MRSCFVKTPNQRMQDVENHALVTQHYQTAYIQVELAKHGSRLSGVVEDYPMKHTHELQNNPRVKRYIVPWCFQPGAS